MIFNFFYETHMKRTLNSPFYLEIGECEVKVWINKQGEATLSSQNKQS